ncbi:MAG: YecA family protein [Candidatus Kapaibacterium sp.]
MTFDRREDIKELLLGYPTLREGTDESARLIVEGELPLPDDSGGVFTSFRIKMIYPKEFPFAFPIVQETGGRIPMDKGDRHISGDKSLCVTAPLNERLICKNGLISSLRFVETILKPYLACQVQFELDPKSAFPRGQYAHGTDGKKEAYCDIFKKGDKWETVRRGIKLIIASAKIQRNDRCFCGSGLKVKDCHIETLEKLKSVGSEFLRKDTIGFGDI